MSSVPVIKSTFLFVGFFGEEHPAIRIVDGDISVTAMEITTIAL